MSENIKNFTAEAAVPRHRIVKFGEQDGSIKLAEGVADNILGVTTEVGADEGERVDVVLSGLAEIEAGSTFSQGAFLVSDSEGKAIPCPSFIGSATIVAQALEAASALEIARVQLRISKFLESQA